MTNSNPFIQGQAPVDPNAPVQTQMAPQGSAAPMSPQSAAPSTDEFEIDLSDVQDNFKVPEGSYMAKCIDVVQGLSKAGNPMYTWTFVLTSSKFAGRDFKSFTAVTPAAMWKVAETVEALGIGKTGGVVKFKRSDVLNKDCGLLIETSEYEGNERSQIAKVISLAEYQASAVKVQ